MTRLPTSGGAWTRDDKGALIRPGAKSQPSPKPKPETKEPSK
jgi:hypothetical protein